MRKLFFTMSFFAILFASSAVFAQEAKLDLSGLSEEQKAQLVIQAEKMKKEANRGIVTSVTDNLSNPQKLNEWVELGKNVGLALTAVAKELGVASDQFLKSDTGKIALVMIVWKVMGKDILDIVGGVATWFIVTSIILWSFNFFHMTKRVKNKEGNTEFVNRYNFQSNDARNISATSHFVAFGVLTIVCMLIVFA